MERVFCDIYVTVHCQRSLKTLFPASVSIVQQLASRTRSATYYTTICLLRYMCQQKIAYNIMMFFNTTSNHDTPRCTVSSQAVPLPHLSKFPTARDEGLAHVLVPPPAIAVVALLVEYDDYAEDIQNTDRGHLDSI